MKNLYHSHMLRCAAVCILAAMLLPLSSCIYITLPEGYESFDEDFLHIDDFPSIQQTEKPLVKEYVFNVSGTYVVRDGYISGTTTPSVQINLADVFDLQALSNKGYVCRIKVNYNCQVNGDHLNVRCSLGGATGSSADYVYIDHNGQASLEHIAYNVSASSCASNPVLYVKWDCKGVTFMDGLNECEISNVTVTVEFSK